MFDAKIFSLRFAGFLKILPGVVPVYEVQPGWCPGSDAAGQYGHTRHVFVCQRDVLAEGKCPGENVLYVNDFFSRRRSNFSFLVLRGTKYAARGAILGIAIWRSFSSLLSCLAMSFSVFLEFIPTFKGKNSYKNCVVFGLLSSCI